MRKIVSLAYVMLLITFAQGQSILQKRDSLKTLLHQKQPDTLRSLRLLELSFTFIESAPDTMLLLSSEALSLSRKVNFLRGEAMSLNRQGIAFYQMGNKTKAMELTLKGMQISERINDLDGMRKAYVSLGNIHSGQPGEDEQALAYQFKAKALAEQLNDKAALSTVLANIGTSYSNLKMYDSAKLFTQQAYDKAGELKSDRMMGVPMLIMGSIHRSTNQPALAIEYYRLGAYYSSLAGDYYHLIEEYNGMASVFDLQKKQDSSLHYAKLALSTSKQKGFLSTIPIASDLLYNFY
jgi:tetratricopeptide (TPR) repeat protein